MWYRQKVNKKLKYTQKGILPKEGKKIDVNLKCMRYETENYIYFIILRELIP